jgi:hypothetical protein
LRTQWFAVPVSGPVTDLQFDPDEWILRTHADELSYDPGPPKIVETEPAPGAHVEIGTRLDSVTVTFHTNVNTAPAHFSLEGVLSGPQSFTILSTTNVNPVVLELDQALESDIYTLTISEDVTAADSAMSLDGEVSDPRDATSLPSGNGEPGGTAEIQFTVGSAPIPAVSEWGLLAMTLLVVVAGTIVFRRRCASS